jgi:fructose-1-phosphate kinase PfkB-like protein
VKPNALEAEEVTGQAVSSPTDALGAAGFFFQQGIELVALSLGADGLLLASQRGAVWARPPRVQARNPVGAGDALLGGIAWTLACPEQSRRERRFPLEEVARWGVATGTAAAVREGVGVGTRAEVEALYEQVQIAPCPPDGSQEHD